MRNWQLFTLKLCRWTDHNQFFRTLIAERISELFQFMADSFPILDRYTAIYAFLAQLFRVWKKKTIHAIFSFVNNAFGRKRFFLAPRAFEKTTEEHGFLHSHTHCELKHSSTTFNYSKSAPLAELGAKQIVAPAFFQ